MPDPELKAGVRGRLKHDPGRIGVLTGRLRSPGAFTKLQIQFPEGALFVPKDQLEAVPAEEDALDLLERGRLGDELDLRLTLAHARLTGRLADVIYSMDVTGTDFYAHQFKPVVRLLNSVARGILIADEVGLGKTIEAGLVWTELRTRYDFRRLLVLCPAVLREKWQRELKNRFGVEAEILDARGTLNRLRQAASDETPGFAIVASLQGLRPRRTWRRTTDRGAASELARFLEDREQADPLIDMCVVDEAHHLRNRETMTSQFARLARTVSDYIVLLTATPIHLRSNDLHELLRLVDEGMFDRGQSFSELLEANAPLVRAREIVVGGTPSAAASLTEQLELELRNAGRNPLLQDNHQLKRLLHERVWAADFSNPANVARVAERLDRLNLLGHTVTRTRRREVQEHRPFRDVKAAQVVPTPAEMEFYSNVTRLVRDYCMASDVSAAFLEVTPQRQMSSSMPAALRLWQQGGGTGHEALDDWTEEEGPLKSELIAQARQLGDLDGLWAKDSKYERLSAILSDWFNNEPDSKVIVFSSYLATLDYLEERLRHIGVRPGQVRHRLPARPLSGLTLSSGRRKRPAVRHRSLERGPVRTRRLHSPGETGRRVTADTEFASRGQVSLRELDRSPDPARRGSHQSVSPSGALRILALGGIRRAATARGRGAPKSQPTPWKGRTRNLRFLGAEMVGTRPAKRREAVLRCGTCGSCRRATSLRRRRTSHRDSFKRRSRLVERTGCNRHPHPDPAGRARLRRALGESLRRLRRRA